MLDSHQHFWSLQNAYTNWPTPDLKAIYRNYGPDDLRPLLARNDVAGTILVQAAPSIVESRALLAIARETDFVEGVVGWIDFEADDALDQLAELADHRKLVGIRPMVQSIEDPEWLLRAEFSPIFEEMARLGLVLDGLVTVGQIGQLAALAGRYPGLKIVLDHCGKPRVEVGRFREWATAVDELAAQINVACKLSGLWTQANFEMTVSNTRLWFDHLFDVFGPDRIIWGSDWPVLEASGTYDAWLAQCLDLTQSLTASQRAAIFEVNGRRIYGLG